MKTLTDTIEHSHKQAQEYGDLHGDGCRAMDESGEACDCDEMKQIYSIIKEAVSLENARWVEAAKAHRVVCRTPEGKRNVTRMVRETSV